MVSNRAASMAHVERPLGNKEGPRKKERPEVMFASQSQLSQSVICAAIFLCLDHMEHGCFPYSVLPQGLVEDLDLGMANSNSPATTRIRIREITSRK